MLQRVAGFLVVLMLMFFQPAEAQEKPAFGLVVPGLKKIHFQPVEHGLQSRFSIKSLIHDPEHSRHTRFLLLNLPTGENYFNSLGFFCKKEVQLEKLIAVPIRFRLGSIEYVDRLEGKGH